MSVHVLLLLGITGVSPGASASRGAIPKCSPAVTCEYVVHFDRIMVLPRAGNVSFNYYVVMYRAYARVILILYLYSASSSRA